MTTSQQPALSLIPSLSKIRRATATDLDCLIRLQMPQSSAPDTRPSLNLALCIDVSGSMTGAPLEFAKSAARRLIERLRPVDRLALVSYASTATIINESVLATEKAKVQALLSLEGLKAMGGTALHAGWLTAAQQVAPFVSAHGLSRVLLLSDGQANVGVIDTDRIAQEALQLLEAGVATSTYGVGSMFNEDLMTRIAAGGQAFYAASADQLCNYVDQDLNLMSSVVARAVSFHLEASVDSQPVDVEFLDDVKAIDHARRASDVLAGGETWLVARVAVKASKDVALNLTVTYEPLDTQGHAKPKQTQTAQLKIPAAARAVKTKGEDADCLSERVKELTAARMQREATTKARAGDWEGVNNLVHGMQGMAAGNAYVGSVAANLAQTAVAQDANLFSKQAIYGAHTMSTRSAMVNEDVTSLQDSLGLRKGDQGKASSGS